MLAATMVDHKRERDREDAPEPVLECPLKCGYDGQFSDVVDHLKTCRKNTGNPRLTATKWTKQLRSEMARNLAFLSWEKGREGEARGGRKPHYEACPKDCGFMGSFSELQHHLSGCPKNQGPDRLTHAQWHALRRVAKAAGKTLYEWRQSVSGGKSVRPKRTRKGKKK